MTHDADNVNDVNGVVPVEAVAPVEATWQDLMALSLPEQLKQILTWPPSTLVQEPALSILAEAYPNKTLWAHIVFTLKERDQFFRVKLLEDALKCWIKDNAPPRENHQTQGEKPYPQGEGWESFLLRNGSGTPKQEVGTICLFLENESPWKEDYWYDSVRGVAMVGENPLDDAMVVELARWLGGSARMAATNLTLIGQCCTTICQQHPRDLLQEWLESLPEWDQVPRLDSWLTTFAGASATAATSDISRLLPVSMVARALHPGCQYRNVVLLEGPEDSGKSSLVRILAGEEWLYECSQTLEGKDAYIVMQGSWVAELPELTSMSRTEESKFKGFITQITDTWVPKWSNFPTHKPRRTIFVGTLNPEGSHEYLRGQTGNTRYLPVATGIIDLQGVAACREQLFAEALLYYREHPTTWWQLSHNGAAEVSLLRDDRRVPSIYETPIHEWLLGTRDMETTWEQIAKLCLNIPEDRWNRATQMEIGKALRALGWERGTKREGKDVHRLWRIKDTI